MKYILTNYARRFINKIVPYKNTKLVEENKTYAILLEIYDNLYLKEIPISEKEILLNYDLIQEVEDSYSDKLIELRYKKNPLEHINEVIFEYTTECNFSCSHCRNGFIERHTETNLDALINVAEVFIRIGIKKFSFIGGEVSKYANKWLELIKQINKYKNCEVKLYTNGWWLEKTNFTAAGIIYKNQYEYLTELKKNGLTNIVFSIDGHQEHHDKQRKQKNLFSRILNNIKKIQGTGLKVNISTIIDDKISKKFKKDLLKISNEIYNTQLQFNSKTEFSNLFLDDNNTFSSFIDIGRAVEQRKGKYKISEINPIFLHCKAFYRPFPSIRVNAKGDIIVCPIINSENIYGNIHDTNIVKILNNFQNNFIFKINLEKKLKDYLKYYDTKIFGDTYDHICSVRTVLMYIAIEIEKNKTKNINEIIKKVAKITGFK